MSWNDPDLTAVERCTFEWAVRVQPEGSVPAGCSVRSLPEAPVVRVRLQGSIELEDLVWQYLYRVWLPESRLEPANAPAIEIYRRYPHRTGWDNLDMWCAIPIVATDQEDP